MFPILFFQCFHLFFQCCVRVREKCVASLDTSSYLRAAQVPVPPHPTSQQPIGSPQLTRRHSHLWGLTPSKPFLIREISPHMYVTIFSLALTSLSCPSVSIFPVSLPNFLFVLEMDGIRLNLLDDCSKTCSMFTFLFQVV